MERSAYWDLNTFQRAALTFEELQSFRKVELMIKGIIAPVQPQCPQEIPSFHEFAKGQGTTVNLLKLGFSTEVIISEEDKETLSKMTFTQINSKYINGESIYGFGRAISPEIVTKEIYPEFSTLYDEYQAKFGDAVALKKQWEAYEKEVDAADKATRDLVNDWQEAQENVALYNRINTTLEEYLAMTDGSRNLAEAFLEKAFNSDDMAIYKRLKAEKENN